MNSQFWTTPRSVLLGSWSGQHGMVASTRLSIPDAGSELRAGQVVLFRILPGQRYRVAGEGLHVGWGFGSPAQLPTAISWDMTVQNSVADRVPSSSQARWIAVQAAHPDAILNSVQVAAGSWPKSRLFDLDAQLYDHWVRGVALHVPVPAMLRPLLDELQALLQLSRARLKQLPAKKRNQTQKAFAHWLMSRWTAESAHLRPLGERAYRVAAPLQRSGKMVYTQGDLAELELAVNQVPLLLEVWQSGIRLRRIERHGAPSELPPPLEPERFRIVPRRRGELEVRLLEGAGHLRMFDVQFHSGLLEFKALHSASGHRQHLAKLGWSEHRLLRLLKLDGLTELSSSYQATVHLAEPKRSELRKESAQRFWTALQPLPIKERMSIQRGQLLRATRWAKPILGAKEANRWSRLPEQPTEEDIAVAALWQTLFPTAGRAEPMLGIVAESHAAALPPDSDWQRISRSYWRNQAPAQPLAAAAPHAHEMKERTPELTPPGLCQLKRARWVTLDSRDLDFALPQPSGTHHRVALLSASSSPGAHSLIELGSGTVATLRKSLGRAWLALPSGPHHFKLRQGTPAWLRLPAGTQTGCNTVRDLDKWWQLRKPARFDLVQGGSRLLQLQSQGGQAEDASVLTVQAGDDRWKLHFASETNTRAEVSLPAGTRQIQIIGPAEATVRVLQQRVRDGANILPEARASNGRANSEASANHTATHPKEALQELSTTTRALSHASGKRLTELQRRRSKLLDTAGLPGLASQLSPGAHQTGDPQAQSTLHLPQAEGQPVALGLTALPLLPDSPRLRLAISRWHTRGPQAALEFLQEEENTSITEALVLQAHLAEQTGNLPLAISSLSALGHSLASPTLLKRAANHAVQLASAAQDLELSRKAHQLTRQVEALGWDVTGLLGRFSGSLHRTSPALEALGYKKVLREHPPTPQAKHRWSEQLRRAAVGAPDGARWLRKPTSLRLNVEESRRSEKKPGTVRLRITGYCHPLKQPRADCGIRVLAGGKSQPCLPEGAGQVPTDRPWSCELSLPTSSNSLTLIPKSSDTLNWFVAESSQGDAPMRAAVPMRRYYEIPEEQPLLLKMRGPAALRIERPADAVSRIELSTQGPDDVEQQTHLLPSLEAEPQSSQLLLTQDGLYTLRVQPRGGSAQIRLTSTTVDRPLRPPRLDSRESPTLDGLSPTPTTNSTDAHPRLLGSVSGPSPRFIPSQEPAGVTWGVNLAWVDRDLTELEREARDRYSQLGLAVHHRFLAPNIQFSGEGFARLRDGPPSYGLRLSLRRPASDWGLGARLRSRITGQELDDGIRLGLSGAATVQSRIPVHPQHPVFPFLTMAARAIASQGKGQRGTDREIYSVFAEQRPSSLDAGIRGLAKLYPDARLAWSTVVRLTPKFNELDKADASIGALSVALPAPLLLSWRLRGSFRPLNELRRDDFFRVSSGPSITGWHWWSQGQRFAATLSATGRMDLLSDLGANWAAFLAIRLGWLSTPGGLRDLPLAERPFTRRQEQQIVVGSAPYEGGSW